jgi:branched-chain amino acid transport system permease protein
VTERLDQARRAAVAAGAAALVFLPFVLDVDQTLYTLMALSAMVAVGLSLLMGFAGQVSFGQAAFYAIGAYAAGILAARYSVPTLLTLAIAPVFTAAAATIVGVPLLRLRGHYLAFATLAVHLIVVALLFTWEGFTGGQIGLIGIPALTVAGYEFQGAALASLAWGFAVAVAGVSTLLVRSRAGRGLQAIATSEASAAALGVNVARYKLKLFVLSAAYAGLAGGFYTYLLNFLTPDSFPVLLSIQFVVMAAVGGMGSVWGGVLGAIAITWLGHELQALGTRPGLPLEAPQVFSIGVYGALLALIMLLFPRGLLPALTGAARGLTGPRGFGPRRA